MQDQFPASAGTLGFLIEVAMYFKVFLTLSGYS